MSRLLLLVLVASACSAAPTTPPADPVGGQDNSLGEKPARYPGEMPVKVAAGLPVEESFFFVASVGGDYYVVLDSPAFQVVDDASISDEVVLLDDAGPLAVGAALSKEASAEILRIARARAATWEVYVGQEMVCAGELGAPLYVSQSYPHFGTEQGWEERPETAPKNSAETRASLLGRDYLMAPVVGCQGAPDRALWARPEGMPPLRAAEESTLTPEQSAKLLAQASTQLAWPEARARVVEAYAKAEPPQEPEESQSVQQFTLLSQGDKPGITLTEANLVVGDTMCGQGPDSEAVTLVWVACKTGLCTVGEEPQGPIEGLRQLSVGMVADFNGDGLFEVVLLPDSLSQTRTLYTIEEGTLVPVKTVDINYNDCPC